MSRIDQGNDRDNVLRDDEGTIAEGDQKLQYLSRLTEQLQYRPVRQKIYREYEDHIDDETEYRISTGMTREEAVEAAVEQMGDPVETGKALDQIHRPEKVLLPWLGMLFILGLGMALVYCIQRDMRGQLWSLVAAALPRRIQINWIDLFLCIIIFTAMSYISYTKYQKFSVWAGLLLMIAPVWYLIHRTGIGGNICPVLDDAVQHLLGGEKGWITRRYYLLYVPIYGLMISYWKGKPHQMEKSLLAMALPLVLSFDASVTDSELGSWGNFAFWTTALYLAFAFVMAVQLNIISLPKRKTVRITGLALVLAKGIYMLYDFAVVCHARWSVYYHHAGWNTMFLFFSEKRRREYSALWKTIVGDDQVSALQLFHVQMMQGIKWIGTSDILTQKLAQNEYSAEQVYLYITYGDLNTLMAYVGILPVVLVLGALTAFTVWLVRKAWRQSDRTGRLLGISIGFVILFRIFYAAAQAFSLTPGNHYVGLIPVFGGIGTQDYSGIAETLALYGMLLSIYRYRNVS